MTNTKWAARPYKPEQQIGNAYFVTQNKDGLCDVFIVQGDSARLFWGDATAQDVERYMQARIEKGWFISVDDIESERAMQWRRGE
jgi:uncharacterized protein YukJ